MDRILGGVAVLVSQEYSFTLFLPNIPLEAVAILIQIQKLT